jgi:hypothetical protein
VLEKNKPKERVISIVVTVGRVAQFSLLDVEEFTSYRVLDFVVTFWSHCQDKVNFLETFFDEGFVLNISFSFWKIHI